ncbi:hypothetical protein [Oleiagrimonas sp. MCCC 1A03011]|uniref:hypothetical protein n=1 Tax=Oleiagrimonas sp. MCCC 1A03011 TaxID=1926883 RepID=UPI000DC3CF91|nr:hypothetical protein [Oleiagrimonas sp. MCCC 1A03011]RAP57996.1 hypothetical protein BTJ49_09090 [Oleiagrimonas sp. MCCC 1A03011]
MFPSSGKHIASTMRFAFDLNGSVLVKHHADRPPASYRAIETWGYDQGRKRYSATVMDNFGGARRMWSDGWKGNVLRWMVDTGKQPAQQFVYVRVSKDVYRVDWKIDRSGHGLEVGDTLTCRRRS